MKLAEAKAKLMEMEREAGIFGVGEICYAGRVTREQYERLIVKDEDIPAKITEARRDNMELFGESPSDDELRASIEAENTKYRALAANAPEEKDDEYEVVF